MRHSAMKIQKNAIRNLIIWGATPWILFKIPSVRTTLLQNFKSPTFLSMGFGTIGYIGGTLSGADKIAENRFRMENSPLAKEGRYMIWRANPEHEWLIGFDNEKAQFQSGNSGYGYQQRNNNNNHCAIFKSKYTI
eukprot:UN26557